MTTSAWLSFTPRDTVFVRDGRAFDAASDAVASSVRPSPTTIAGALGAAFGGKNPLAVRGPILARQEEGGTWRPYFPVPADLVQTTDGRQRVHRLAPEPAAGDCDLDDVGLRLLVAPRRAEPVKPLTGWVPGAVLARYLAGQLEPGRGGLEQRELRLEDPLVPEQRVGLARENRTAKQGYLYQATHLRPKDGWGFLAEYDVPDARQAGLVKKEVPFGGRGRLADLQPTELSWPDATAGVGQRVLVYLATPAVWHDGWRLPIPEGATLVAAVTGEPEPTVTVKREQDQWRASRVLRWAVPAGSVYLLEFPDAKAGAEWASKWNGRALNRTVRDDRDQDTVRTAGFGVVLTGAWT